MENPIDLLIGYTSRETLERELKNNGVQVRKFISLSNDSERKGVFSIEQRIRSLEQNTFEMVDYLDTGVLSKITERLHVCMKNGRRVYSTGIGSSEAHSKYLEVIFKRKIKHINSIDLLTF